MIFPARPRRFAAVLQGVPHEALRFELVAAPVEPAAIAAPVEPEVTEEEPGEGALEAEEEPV